MAKTDFGEFVKTKEYRFLVMLSAGFTSFDIHVPGPKQYTDSPWWKWEDRIREGQMLEEKALARRVEEIEKKYGQPDSEFPYDEIAGDEYWEICNLSNTMAACLVVSLWSEMEAFFKNVVRSSLKLKGSSKKPPYKFGDQKKLIAKHFGIALVDCPEYSTINGVRTLNNSFKHKRGVYVEDPKTEQVIAPELLEIWGIENGQEIQFINLPFEDLVTKSWVFADSLFKSIRQAEGLEKS